MPSFPRYIAVIYRSSVWNECHCSPHSRRTCESEARENQLGEALQSPIQNQDSAMYHVMVVVDDVIQQKKVLHVWTKQLCSGGENLFPFPSLRLPGAVLS